MDQITKPFQEYDQKIYISALKKISNDGTHHLIHTGDVGDIGVLKEHEEGMRKIKKYFKSAIPQNEMYRAVTVCPGNHDYYRKAAFKENSFMKTFAETTGGMNFPYVKILGGFIAVIVLRTRHLGDWKSTTRGSIKKWEMKKANEHMEELYRLYPNTKLFKILVMHHSPVRRFLTEIHESMGTLSKKYRKRIQNFINKHQVDMCLTGHTHGWKLLQNPKKTGGCVFVDAGSATRTGRRFFHLDEYPGYCEYSIDPEKGLVKIERNYWKNNKFVNKVHYSINED